VAGCRTLEAGSQQPQAQEADMSGLILLVFIAVIVAFGFTRMRGKMKLGVTSKHWTTVIVLVVLVVLVAYAAHSGH
jgi:heme A synthase